MKQVKNKYIRLTETQLNNIIKEEVSKQLKYLIEYAQPRNKFVENCANHFKRILENWCLCRFCTLTDTDVNKCHHHWRSELLTHLNAIADMHIKKNDAVETRYKAIVEGFETVEAFNGAEYLYNKVKGKFGIEKIDRKDKNVIQTASDFNNDLNNIIGILARANDDEIYEYAFSI